MDPVRTAFESRSVVSADAGIIRYCVAGGAGAPVLALPGWFGQTHAWSPLLASMSAHHRCIAMEYRGLRAGEAAPGVGMSRVHAYAQDAIAVLDAEGEGRVAVAAWSVGVAVALEMFRIAPQRVAALVLINGRAGSVKAGVANSAHVPLWARAVRRAPAVAEWLARTANASPETLTWARRLGVLGAAAERQAAARVVASVAELDARRFAEFCVAMAQFDGRTVLRDIDVPTLVIAGDRDPFTSRGEMEVLAQEIRGAEYTVLPGTGHFALLDHNEHLGLRMEKFFGERGYVVGASSATGTT